MQAREKATNAYGESIDRDLAKAIQKLSSREGRLERCMRAMRMTVPPAQLRQRLKAPTPKAAPPGNR